MVLRAQTSVVGQGSAKVIPGSTIFDEEAVSTLSRTPGTAGNRRTWTFSCWIKKTDVGNTAPIFLGGSDTNNYFKLTIGSDDKLYAMYNASGAYNENFRSTQLFRDTNAWMHIVLAWDTTRAAASDRVKVYINGTEIDGTRTNDPAQNYQGDVNNTVHHDIGRATYNAGEWFNGYISEVIFLDGQLLGPEYFAYTDPLTNTWRPKKYTQGVFKEMDKWTCDTYNSWNSGQTALKYQGIKFLTAAGGKVGWRATGTSNTGLHVYTSTDNSTWTRKLSGVTVDSTGLYYESSEQYVIIVNPSDAIWSNEQVIISDQNGATIHYSNGTYPGNGTPTMSWTGPGFTDGTLASYNSFHLPLDGTGFSAFQTIGNMVQDQSGKQNNYTSGGTLNFSSESSGGVALSVDNNAGVTTTGYPTSYATLDFTAYEMSTCANRKDGGLSSRIENSGTITGHPVGDMTVSSGKWYYEWIWVSTTDSAAWCSVANPNTAYTNGKFNNHWKLRGSGGEKQWWLGGVKQAEVNTSADYSTGDTIGVAIDMDEGKWYVSTNGTWQDAGNGAGDPINGTGYVHNNIKSAGTGTIIPMWGTDGGSTTCVMSVNFGQKAFGYAPPKGFLPMCVANLPSTESTLPGEHFKPVKYTGNTSGNLAVGGVGFSPDILWIKHLQGTDSWEAEDSVRGAGNRLILNAQGGQSTPGSQWNVVSFDSDGFTVGSGPSECNRDAQTHVSYSWKAGGSSGTFNVDGKAFASAADAGLDGGSVSATGASVGTKSGLSVLEFTATGSNMTIAHGLEKAPEFVIVHGIYDWGTYHSYLGGTKSLWMNEKNVTTSSDIWQDTAPTSSVVSLGTNVNVNNNTSPTVLYAWHSVPGLSKFGSYCGNGNVNGQNVFCGFKPAMVIIKDVSNDSWDWYLVDSARDTYNMVTHTIYPSQNYAEDNSTDYNSFDFTASGFKVKGKPSNSEPTNNDGEIYVYAAWAETPLNNAYGAQSTAR